MSIESPDLKDHGLKAPGLKVTVDRGICELRLAAPPGNVMDMELCRELTRVVQAESANPDLKAFLFTAEGKHFSYGASVPQHVAGPVSEFLPAFHDLFEALVNSCVPTVAAVRGVCFGGAFELAAFCNFLVAERGARFAVPEITLGVFPPVACVVFPWRFGGGRSDAMILGGGTWLAEDDIAHHVCEQGELEQATEKFLDETIRSRSASVLRLTQCAARAPLHEAIQERLRPLERMYLNELMALPDAREGIAAFLEKRQPDWAMEAVR
jgi:cyclohexa-1,5-dienecarbonyl-CoA hydratase